MAQGLSVVLGDYDRQRLDATCAALEDRGIRTVRCESGSEVLERCQKEPPEVAVLEVLLPRKNGFETLKALKEDARTAAIKVILLLDEGDDYGEHRARLCGADAIRKRPLTAEDVAETVRLCLQEGGLEAISEASEGPDLEAVLDAMEGRARAENPLLQHITDPLTGLYNSPYMELKIAEEYKKARRFNIPLSCVEIAFDDEGALSQPDRAQDLRRILNEVAGLLLCESRDIDHLARQNVEEFFLLLPHTDVEGASAMTGRILKSVESRGFEVDGRPGMITASAGIATFTGSNADSAEQLQDRCREALTASRRWGGNRFTVWAQDTEKTPQA